MSVATEITRLQTAKANLKTAIEAKGVTVSSSATLDAYPALVEEIPSGGGNITEKLVNFYDFDGTLVASYTGQEAQALTELPSAPDHSSDEVPLTFDAWNWTLAQIKSYNTSYPDVIIIVGANYHTTDGKNHFYFNITSDSDENGVEIVLNNNYSSGTVDWGDGTVESISTSTISHIYTSIDEFHCIVDSNCTSYMVGSIYDNTRQGKREKLTKVYFSNTVTSIVDGSFKFCYSLQSITIPNTVTNIGSNNTFCYCYSLQSIAIPSGVTGIGTQTFSSCYSLQSIAIPNTVTSIVNCFSSCASLQSITIPSGVTSIGDGAFNSCYSLQSITIPSGVTSIGMQAFCYCYSLQSIAIPNTVTNIEESSFLNCYSLQSITIPSEITRIKNTAFLHCYCLYSITTLATTPPTLGTNVFETSYTKKIYVPYSADHSVLATYQATSGWSDYASIMEELPE